MKVPGVQNVVSRVGRGESPADPAGPNEADVLASLTPYGERPKGLTQDVIAEQIRERLVALPGINLVSEIQRPLAIVVIGGLLSSTALTLLLVPVVYAFFEGSGGSGDSRLTAEHQTEHYVS